MKGSSRGYVTSSHHMQIKSEQLQSNSFINPWCCKSKWIAQLCLTLCNPMDYNLPGSSAHGIFQARTLEWVAISLSRGSSQPKDQTLFSCILCTGRRILYDWATWEAHSDPVTHFTGQALQQVCKVLPVLCFTVLTTLNFLVWSNALIAM